MKSNRFVCESWLAGKPGRSRNMHTDGKDIYSYALRIGRTNHNSKELYNYTSRNTQGTKGRFISLTTSHHVGLLIGRPGVTLQGPAEQR